MRAYARIIPKAAASVALLRHGANASVSINYKAAAVKKDAAAYAVAVPSLQAGAKVKY